MKADQLAHHYIVNPALPYVSNDSPTSKDPAFQDGTTNVLTSSRGYAEKRNGFGFLEADTAFVFSGTVKRFHTWRRWTGASITFSGQYFMMTCDVGASASRVYKQQFNASGTAVDAYPVLVHTDATSANPFDFVVSNDFIYFGNGVDMKKYDGSSVTNWGITGPSAAVTFTSGAGALSPTSGYRWQIAFENSATGHISSPSAASVSTSAGTLRKYTISGNTTSDAQVDKVRIFRTVDGGSIFFEHPASPIAYATWTASGYEDNTVDVSLTSNVAPLVNQNNRPTATFGSKWFANRIWTFVNDTLYYSDFEELVRGVEEESFSSVNYRFFGKEIFGLAVAGPYLLIFTPSTIYRIYGDSLPTFRMDVLAEGKGALNSAAIVEFNGFVGWLDTSDTVWITDGQTIAEKDLSESIRPDLTGIVHSTAAMAYHRSSVANWLILMDGGNGKLYIHDIDTKQWMPPWVISGCTAIRSGHISTGAPKLFIAKNAAPLVQGTGYQDAGANYGVVITSSLFDLVPADNPSAYGIMDHVELETDSHPASTVAYLTDEDPVGAAFTAAGAAITPPHRTQGTNLVEQWYMTLSDPNLKGARRIALQLTWSAANAAMKLYGAAVAYRVIQ